MKVLFFGSCNFSLASLNKLLTAISKVDVVCNRNTLLHDYASKLKLNLYPLSSRDDLKNLSGRLKTAYDFGVVVSFGYFIPEDLIDKFKGAINLHPSLLPLHRGAAPIQRSMLHQRNLFGVSVISLDKQKFDHGIVYAQKRILINQKYSMYYDMEKKLGQEGSELLSSVLLNYDRVKLNPKTQHQILEDFESLYGIKISSDSDLEYARKIRKSEAQIDIDKCSADDIYRKYAAISHHYPIHFKDFYFKKILFPTVSIKKEIEILKDIGRLSHMERGDIYFNPITNTMFLMVDELVAISQVSFQNQSYDSKSFMTRFHLKNIKHL